MTPNLRATLAAFLVALSILPARAADWQARPELGALFDRAGVTGTFVLHDVTAGRLLGHDEARARTRFVPASTFKIANTLIGLDAGSVASVDERLPYGGGPQPFKTWERDMGLRDAIVLSNVPIYQELARRTGRERMQAGIARLAYGNAETGAAVDRFWLDGPLKISAVEQVHVLTRLARGELPFPPAVQAATRDILRLEQGDGWTLYGKTGWQNAPGPGIGWWVGWVDKGGRTYAFALNLDIRQAADADQRIPLGKACLRALSVL